MHAPEHMRDNLHGLSVEYARRLPGETTGCYVEVSQRSYPAEHLHLLMQELLNLCSQFYTHQHLGMPHAGWFELLQAGAEYERIPT